MKRRSEQRVLMLLQVLLLVGIIGILAFLLTRKDDGTSDAVTSTEQSRGNAAGGSGRSNATGGDSAANAEMVAAPESFTFDPNTADSATLVRVGLSSWQAHNVIRYRQKGGQYHRPEDFKSLYGLTVGQWEHLAPLISIGKEYQYLADNEDVSRRYPTGKENRTYGRGADNREWSEKGDAVSRDRGGQHRDSSSSPFASNNRVPKLRQGETVALASADTMALERIPGIGGYYARRITEYGEKLGGYVSLEQLNDAALDFLPMGIEQYLTLGESHVRKLRVNKLSVRELSHHPYISYPQAKQIAERVRVYGAFKDWDELLFLSEFTEKDKARLEPYVSFE